MLTKTNKGNRVERIKSLRFHSDLKKFGSLGDVRSDLIFVTKRLTGKTVCTKFQRFPEAIIDGKDDRKAFLWRASILFTMVYGRITFHLGSLALRWRLCRLCVINISSSNSDSVFELYTPFLDFEVFEYRLMWRSSGFPWQFFK